MRDRPRSTDPFDPMSGPLIRNRDGYIAHIERMVAMADIVKLSREDG
jgi:hypothetical protein